ncbi:hypothetical protein EW145_g4034 [Phellinidium pouzarii]|uniref:Inhibitor I9 domain-containing protein n=1 Tax=Phellinidium pouzarii TaxID=167371 RepID=A0A4S4L5H0_9AGAM|nr:hypothetical protein EW145_g4034 [Phellinidium pouzarii]
MSGNYMVVFKDDVSPDSIKELEARVTANGGEITQPYDPDSIFSGFSAKIPNTLISEFNSLVGDGKDNLIKYIEPDQEVRIQT